MRAPIAEHGTNCPLYRKPVEKVCHTCALYVQLRGKHPQTGVEIDTWLCAFAATAALQMEAARQSHSTTVAVETMRNEVVGAQARKNEAFAEFTNRSVAAISALSANPKLLPGQ